MCDLGPTHLELMIRQSLHERRLITREEGLPYDNIAESSSHRWR